MYSSITKDIKSKIQINSKNLYERTFLTTKHFTNDTMRLAYAFTFLITSNFLFNLGIDENYLTEFNEILNSKQFSILNRQKTLIGIDDVFIKNNINSEIELIELKLLDEDYIIQRKKKFIQTRMLKL